MIDIRKAKITASIATPPLPVRRKYAAKATLIIMEAHIPAAK
jgi:hypothetical protein